MIDQTKTTANAAGTSTDPESGDPNDPGTSRYLAPDASARWIVNPVMAGLARLGVGVWGARVLEVRGRTSGEWRSVPVNPLELDGRRFLVAPRGDTHWVRNLRSAGRGRLRKGRRVEVFVARELADRDKLSVIRAYLTKWAFEVGRFFDGVTADSSDEELLSVTPGVPVFEITAT